LSRLDKPANALFKIGELAQRTGRSTHTIRWYEARGLIPGVARDAAGRRRYHYDHVQRLELVERLRRTGISIAEWKRSALLVKDGRNSVEQRRAVLERHRQRALAELETWQAAVLLIDSKIDFYSTWIASGKRPKEPPSVSMIGKAVPKTTRRSR
jgi:DNA-binding transcriptional MerR regulator